MYANDVQTPLLVCCHKAGNRYPSNSSRLSMLILGIRLIGLVMCEALQGI